MTRAAVAQASSHPRPPTTVSILKGLVQSDRPVRNLYRGLCSTLVANAASQGSFFFFKAHFEGILLRAKNAGSDVRAYQNDGGLSSSVTSHLTPADYFVASTMAGAATQILTNPLWVLRTRMVTQDRSATGAYPNMWAGAKDLLRSEGFKGFYRGLGIGMLTVSHGGIQFAVYEPVKRMILGSRRKGEERTLTIPETIVLSATSKLIAGTATLPLVTVRNRLQNNDARQLYGRGLRQVVANLWRDRGIRGFYAGLVPATVRVLPGTVIMFLVIENVRTYLPRLVHVSQ